MTHALALAEKLIQKSDTDNHVLWEFAQACLLAGRLAAAKNQSDTAQRQWARALEALAPRREQTNDWQILDPAAQALVLSGKTAEARPLIERLQRFGYHSGDPLAAPILAVVSPSVTPTKK